MTTVCIGISPHAGAIKGDVDAKLLEPFWCLLNRPLKDDDQTELTFKILSSYRAVNTVRLHSVTCTQNFAYIFNFLETD